MCAAALWLINQGVRLTRLHRAVLFEKRAAASLLNTPKLRGFLITSFVLISASSVLMLGRHYAVACATAFAGILLARYLFFVSVVPLNMALTFVHRGEQ